MEARQQIEQVVALVRDVAENSDLHDVCIGVDVTRVPAALWAELEGAIVREDEYQAVKRLYSRGGCYVHAYRSATPVVGAVPITKAAA